MSADDVSVSDDNALLAIIKEARRNGKDYLEIERLYGIPSSRAEAMLQSYYKDRASKIDPVEQRMLQLDRLEGLIDILYSMALMGNVKSAETLGKLLEQISSLLGLNLEQTKIEMKIVTEQQSRVVFEITEGTTDALLRLVQELVKDQKVLGAIEERWDATASDAYSGKVEEIIVAELVG